MPTFCDECYRISDAREHGADVRPVDLRFGRGKRTKWYATKNWCAGCRKANPGKWRKGAGWNPPQLPPPDPDLFGG